MIIWTQEAYDLQGHSQNVPTLEKDQAAIYKVSLTSLQQTSRADYLPVQFHIKAFVIMNSYLLY